MMNVIHRKILVNGVSKVATLTQDKKKDKEHGKLSKN